MIVLSLLNRPVLPLVYYLTGSHFSTPAGLATVFIAQRDNRVLVS